MAIIEIDKDSGFCFGVVNAIRKAEEELLKDGHLYCLGDIVHNNQEVDRLRLKGLETICKEQFLMLQGVKVLLRAHGEPPETYACARKNDIEIIDATCPVVLQLQRKIKKAYEECDAANTQIVIYGKVGHAEVNGLVGQTNGSAIVIEGLADLRVLDFSKDIRLYSQTTKSVSEFQTLVEEIGRRIQPGTSFLYYDTICRQVANRIPNIRAFAARHQSIIFVSGKKSSNGKILYDECIKVNPDSHSVTGIGDIDPDWLVGKETIGICGATSTPKWLMEEVYSYVNRLLNGDRTDADRNK